MAVADASLITDYLLGRPSALEAMDDTVHERGAEPLHAPSLMEPEVLNALRNLERSGKISATRAQHAVNDLGKLRLVSYPHGPFRERIWKLRHNLSAYDATYVALAERLGDVRMLTADRGLADVARDVLGARRVTHVA